MKAALRMITLLAGIIGLSLPSAYSQSGNVGAAAPKSPLTLREQGSFFVGENIEKRSPNSGLSTDSMFAPGDIAVNQMYVEFQIPAEIKGKYPIIMIHGGCHTGAVYRTTPDGREGWYTSFARRGYPVYVVDTPNRGRSGWDPTNRFAVTAGQKPASELELTNIYSAQMAWTAFRIGKEYPIRYPDGQFPTEYFTDYLKQLVPSYRTDTINDIIADDVSKLVDRIGPCVIIGWSTGTLNAMQAASMLNSGNVKR